MPVVRFDDIISEVGRKLLASNYYQLDVEEKKELIDIELKEYIISKFSELNIESLLPNNCKELSVSELLSILAAVIPKKKHSDTISHFTHYILGLVTELQGWAVLWHIDKNKKIDDSPETVFFGNGVWDKLVTSEDADYVETFNFTYHVFNHIFITKKGKRVFGKH